MAHEIALFDAHTVFAREAAANFNAELQYIIARFFGFARCVIEGSCDQVFEHVFVIGEQTRIDGDAFDIEKFPSKVIVVGYVTVGAIVRALNPAVFVIVIFPFTVKLPESVVVVAVVESMYVNTTSLNVVPAFVLMTGAMMLGDANVVVFVRAV